MMLFCKMFIVFYTVKIVYICVFMIYSTSYCLCDTRIHGMYVCTSQNMANYIVTTVLTLNLALFFAVHIECSIFSSMGVFYLTALLVKCYVYVVSMEHD
jgi:hypothetical protein